MFKLNFDDTITAISTPLGQGGIGIVRLSGKDALPIANKIFVSKDKKKPSKFKSYTVHYGWIKDDYMKSSSKKKQSSVIDEVILTVMRSPKTYTREDVVEINCHSGMVPLRRILEAVVKNGARLAEPGEFTRRAFINGRIDLIQAEAVLDIIQSKTEASFKLGINQLKGDLSDRIEHMRNETLEMLTHVEADINFPDEEDVSSLPKARLIGQLKKVKSQLNDILCFSQEGKILREGISVVICGKPNVGKSSLLNAIIRKEKAIVTAVAGTTRDSVEDEVSLSGIPVRLIDTAGIEVPENIVEEAALLKSRQNINEADVVIMLFDASMPISKKDKNLISEIKDKNIIYAVNKIDLPEKINIDKLKKICGVKKIIRISALKKQGLNLLEKAVVKSIMSSTAINSEQIIISNVRHITLLKSIKEHIDCAISSLDKALPIEFVAEELKVSLDFFDRLIGNSAREDLLDKIFSEFCICK